MRLGVYCDYAYRATGDAVYAELPFALFLEGLAAHCERLVVLGRLDPSPEPFPYRLATTEFSPLPFYRSGADLGAVLRAVPSTLRRFWRVLDDLDVIWVLGPNPPQTILFALMGRLRGRRVVLGVRQNLPELIRHRRRGNRHVLAAAIALEATFRALSLRLPVVVVGSDLARRYRHARAVLNLYVSLLRGSDLLPDDGGRDYESAELNLLSVGRLDPEKNPLLLADVLAYALEHDRRWRLHVCGDGPLTEALAARAVQLGIDHALHLHGYVPIDGGLWELYRSAHALLHVSMTEGVPQVILEAFAARLPVVATNVGGVTEVVSGRGMLVPPGDPEAAAEMLELLVTDAGLRRRLVEAGHRAAADHTLEAECVRLAGFLSMNS